MDQAQKYLVLSVLIGLLSLSAFADEEKGRLKECRMSEMAVGFMHLSEKAEGIPKVWMTARCTTSENQSVQVNLKIPASSLANANAIANLVLKAKEERATFVVDYVGKVKDDYLVSNISYLFK